MLELHVAAVVLQFCERLERIVDRIEDAQTGISEFLMIFWLAFARQEYALGAVTVCLSPGAASRASQLNSVFSSCMRQTWLCMWHSMVANLRVAKRVWKRPTLFPPYRPTKQYHT